MDGNSKVSSLPNTHKHVTILISAEMLILYEILLILWWNTVNHAVKEAHIWLLYMCSHTHTHTHTHTHFFGFKRFPTVFFFFAFISLYFLLVLPQFYSFSLNLVSTQLYVPGSGITFIMVEGEIKYKMHIVLKNIFKATGNFIRD